MNFSPIPKTIPALAIVLLALSNYCPEQTMAAEPGNAGSGADAEVVPAGSPERKYAPRTWTSADGTQTFVGEYVSQTKDKVTIKKEGEALTFSISRLSKEDQTLLMREQMLPGATAIPESKPKAPKMETAASGPSIAGRWKWNTLNLVYTIISTEEGHSLTLHADGTLALEEEVTAKQDGKRVVIRPKKVSPTGDHWILDEEKNLLVMDAEGLIYKADAF